MNHTIKITCLGSQNGPLNDALMLLHTGRQWQFVNHGVYPKCTKMDKMDEQSGWWNKGSKRSNYYKKWPVLIEIDKFGSILIHFDPFWCILDPFWLFVNHGVYPKCIKMYQNIPKWIQNASKWMSNKVVGEIEVARGQITIKNGPF